MHDILRENDRIVSFLMKTTQLFSFGIAIFIVNFFFKLSFRNFQWLGFLNCSCSVKFKHNYAFAFSWGNVNLTWVAYLLLFVLLISILFLSEWSDPLRKTGFYFFWGGCFSNVLERLCQGYVVDFIQIPFLNRYYLIINLNDILIVLGVLLVLFTIVSHNLRLDRCVS